MRSANKGFSTKGQRVGHVARRVARDAVLLALSPLDHDAELSPLVGLALVEDVAVGLNREMSVGLPARLLVSEKIGHERGAQLHLTQREVARAQSALSGLVSHLQCLANTVRSPRTTHSQTARRSTCR